jgi:hypothetical protein
MILPTTSSVSWVERYEALRRHVIEGCQILESEPLSLILWLAQGMAGWMRHWAEAVVVAPSLAVVPRALPFTVTSPWQKQLTLLLAQITVQRLYPAPRL